MVPCAASIPATMSATEAPTLLGGPSGSPVMLISPPSPWMTTSKPGSLARGPVWPKPETEVRMARGLMRWISFHEKPSLSSVPGR